MTKLVSPPDEEAVREYALGQLRCAHLRARLYVMEIESIGRALRSKMIGPWQALDMLEAAGLLEFLRPAVEAAPPEAPAASPAEEKVTV